MNWGCTTTGRLHGRSRATSENASAAPAVASTSSTGSPCCSATACSAAVADGVGADVVQARAQGLVEPRRPGPGVDVDGEVQQAVAGLGVAVVAQRADSASAVRSRRSRGAGGTGHAACTASANRWASRGWPAQWRGGRTRAAVGEAKPMVRRLDRPGAASPAVGSTWVRWNSWPVTTSPARVSSESPAATAAG